MCQKANLFAGRHSFHKLTIEQIADTDRRPWVFTCWWPLCFLCSSNSLAYCSNSSSVYTRCSSRVWGVVVTMVTRIRSIAKTNVDILSITAIYTDHIYPVSFDCYCLLKYPPMVSLCISRTIWMCTWYLRTIWVHTQPIFKDHPSVYLILKTTWVYIWVRASI